MSKDYLCKDCLHNNHGWCKAIKRNKLKEINKCAMKDDGSKQFELRPFEETLEAPIYVENNIQVKEYEKVPQPKPMPILLNQKENDYSFEHETLGKRIMLWTIQRQAIAIVQDDNVENKFEELCRCIVNIAGAQTVTERIGDFNEILMESDKILIEDSKKVTELLDGYIKKLHK